MSRQANYMVRSHIRSIDANASRLRDMVGPQTKVDEWAKSYVATADDRLNAVHDYLSYRDMKGLGNLTPTHVAVGGGVGTLAFIGLALAAPRLFYGVDMKKLAIAGALGFALFGGGTGLYYLNQQANDPFGGSN